MVSEAKPVEWNYETDDDLASVAKARPTDGIDKPTVLAKLERGQSIEKTLTEPRHKNTRRTYVVDDHAYPSLKALADAAGISYAAAVKRAHRGWTDRELFYGRSSLAAQPSASKPEKKRRGLPVEVSGKTYGNIFYAYAAIQPSVSINTVRKRLFYGWSPDEALGVVERQDGRTMRMREITVGGETMNLTTAAARYSLSMATIAQRLDRGASAEQAVGIAAIGKAELLPISKIVRKRKIEKVSLVVKGVEYKSYTALGAAFGLPAYVVRQRIRDYGWSMEEAISEPANAEVVVDGVKYRSAMNAWQTVGRISLANYQARKTAGLPLEICLGHAPLPPQERWEVDGRSYSSLQDVAEKYGLTRGQLAARMQFMSLEEAIHYVPTMGRYSETLFAEDPQLAKTQGLLYFICIRQSNGVLHKIGITQKTVQQRFANHEFVVIETFSGELLHLYRVEQQIRREFCEQHYRGDEDFEGRTETLLLTENEERMVLARLRQLVPAHGETHGSE